MVIAPFNDIDAVEVLIKRNRDQLACVLAEPILGDAGIIPPVPGFLEGLRRICDENDVVLIFDEIITGFRVSLGGAQELYGVIPDITCVAKAVGGGTPGAAAFGGKKEIMELEADGIVLHGGTYSGNPMTLAGMNAALDILINDRERVYGHLNTIANAMVQGMRGIFAENGVPAYISQVGPMWQVFFGHEEPVTKYRQARASDTRFFEHAADRVPDARRVLPQLQLRALLRQHGAHQDRGRPQPRGDRRGDEDRQEAAERPARRRLSRARGQGRAGGGHQAPPALLICWAPGAQAVRTLSAG